MSIIMDIIELEKYFIMVFGFALAIVEGLLYFKYTKRLKKLLYMVIGLFWMIFMFCAIIDPYFSDIDQIIGRSGILFTLAVILGNSINNYRILR